MSEAGDQFSWEDAEEVFAVLAKSGWRPIIIGGQAVNFWVQWCEREAEADFGPEPFASKDIDLVGNKGHVQQCAKILHGTPHVPGPDHMTPEQGYVEAVVSSGRTVRIDFLADSLPNAAKEVRENALPFNARWGQFYVMDPVACMKSRVYNVVQIPGKYDNAHGVRQLRASIQVVPLFCQWVIREGGDDAARTVLAMYKAVYKFTVGQHAKKLWKSHSIDTFDSVQLLDGLPQDFQIEAYPRWKEKVDAGRA